MPLGRDRTRENGLTVTGTPGASPLQLTTGAAPNATGEVPAAHRGFIASISLGGVTGGKLMFGIITDHVGGWSTFLGQAQTESGGVGDQIAFTLALAGPGISAGAVVDVAWVAPAQLLNNIGGLIGCEFNTLGGLYQRKDYVSNIMVECLAGGGGGAGSGIAGAQGAGSGGGAGGYARRLIASSALASDLTIVTVGSGGASATGAAGSAGGSTLFEDAVVGVTACGGGGGATGGFNGGLGGCGGTGLCGDFLCDGGDGDGGCLQAVVVSGAVTPITGHSGKGGASYWGGGAPGPVRSATNAAAIIANTGAKAFGAGGGGGAIGLSSTEGSVGKQGVVVVWEFL